MVLEIIITKFSCVLKIMSRNNFPEPQPDSASYADKTDAAQRGGVGQMLTLDDIGGGFFGNADNG